MNFFKIIAFFLLINFTTLSGAENNVIEINKGNSSAINIAIAQSKISSYVSQSFATDITNLIKEDLTSSGFFRVISDEAFIERKIGISHTPLYSSWRQINAALLLNMEIKKLDGKNDEYDVSIVLWDIVLNKSIVGQSFEFNKKLWRRVAHKIADKIYEQVTAQDGYFDTKIVYVAEYFSNKKKITRLAMMDVDGKNHVYLTDGKDLVSTPRLSPDGTKILYLSYERKKPRVFIYDMITGKERILGHFKGLSFAPRFSPDGKKSVMSIANNGMINIFEIDMRSFRMKKLTDNFGINTSPCYSPDGSKIVFNSDISGYRHLYIMDFDGSNKKRISFGSGIYASPVWSPKGDMVACTRITKDQGFNISILDINSGNERIISSGYLVENPSWAPNGTMVSYTKFDFPTQESSYLGKIYVVDIAGRNEKQIITPRGSKMPEWYKPLD